MTIVFQTLLATVLLLDEVNAMRANPAAYAEHLEARLRHYDGKLLRLPKQVPRRTMEGATAVREAIRALRAAKPAPELKHEPLLSRAASDHVREIGPKGLVSTRASMAKGQPIASAGTCVATSASGKSSASAPSTRGMS
jgi:uncharacterized protein YkwD